MNKLELDYLKQRALQTTKVRYWLKRGIVPEFVDGDPIRQDMYSSVKLTEDAVSPKKPRIGPEFQAFV